MAHIHQPVVGSVLAGALSLAVLVGPAYAGTVQLIDRADLGVKVIHFQGEVTKGDLQRIQALVPEATAANPSNQVFVSLHSPGGLAWEGVAIGRYLREQGIGTILLPDAACASACSFAFWGGYDAKAARPRRIAMPGARLGVHQMSFSTKDIPQGTKVEAHEAFEEFQRRIAMLMEYLSSMDVALDVQKRNFATGSKDIHVPL